VPFGVPSQRLLEQRQNSSRSRGVVPMRPSAAAAVT